MRFQELGEYNFRIDFDQLFTQKAQELRFFPHAFLSMRFCGFNQQMLKLNFLIYSVK
jgi:hypothetical protein